MKSIFYFFLAGAPVIVLLFSFYMQKEIWLEFCHRFACISLFMSSVRPPLASSVVNGNLEICKYRI